MPSTVLRRRKQVGIRGLDSFLLFGHHVLVLGVGLEFVHQPLRQVSGPVLSDFGVLRREEDSFLPEVDVP